MKATGTCDDKEHHMAAPNMPRVGEPAPEIDAPVTGDGRIERVWAKVHVEGHAAEVLDEIRARVTV